MGLKIFLLIVLVGVGVAGGHVQRFCHSCISPRLALDENAFPRDILRAVPKSTDYCDQERFNRREADFSYCDAPCVVAAVWDRQAHGSYPPIGYVRGCISDFVRFRPWTDIRHGRLVGTTCQLMPLRNLILPRKRSILDSGERLVNLCLCNSTYCNDSTLRAGASRGTGTGAVGVMYFGLVIWYRFGA